MYYCAYAYSLNACDDLSSIVKCNIVNLIHRVTLKH